MFKFSYLFIALFVIVQSISMYGKKNQDLAVCAIPNYNPYANGVCDVTDNNRKAVVGSLIFMFCIIFIGSLFAPNHRTRLTMMDLFIISEYPFGYLYYIARK